MASAREETIHGYITDMLALEEHIGKALDAQIETFAGKYGSVTAELAQMRQKITAHEKALQVFADQHEGDAAQKLGDVVKRAGSILLGFGAGAIDLVRTEKLPKNLRDDFTAFSLATIGYVMLETTAVALERSDVATMAQAHLQGYTRMLKGLQQMIPAAVVAELRTADLGPLAEVGNTIETNLRAAWQGA